MLYMKTDMNPEGPKWARVQIHCTEGLYDYIQVMNLFLHSVKQGPLYIARVTIQHLYKHAPRPWSPIVKKCPRAYSQSLSGPHMLDNGCFTPTIAARSKNYEFMNSFAWLHVWPLSYNEGRQVKTMNIVDLFALVVVHTSCWVTPYLKSPCCIYMYAWSWTGVLVPKNTLFSRIRTVFRIDTCTANIQPFTNHWFYAIASKLTHVRTAKTYI